MSKFFIIWYDVEFIEVGSKKILKNGYKMTRNRSVTRSRAPHESCASKHCCITSGHWRIGRTLMAARVTTRAWPEVSHASRVGV